MFYVLTASSQFMYYSQVFTSFRCMSLALFIMSFCVFYSQCPTEEDGFKCKVCKNKVGESTHKLTPKMDNNSNIHSKFKTIATLCHEKTTYFIQILKTQKYEKQ